MKCICPYCEKEFFQEREFAILSFIKKNPGCSYTDIHWDIKIAQKNVYIRVLDLEKRGLVIIKSEGKCKKKIYLTNPDINQSPPTKETKQ